RWQQENGRALLKRLLVASMACVLAWRLGNSRAPQAEEARRVVMRLGGRQGGHGQDYTPEGLLAGRWGLPGPGGARGWRHPPSHLGALADFVLHGSVAPAAAGPSVQRGAGGDQQNAPCLPCVDSSVPPQWQSGKLAPPVRPGADRARGSGEERVCHRKA